MAPKSHKVWRIFIKLFKNYIYKIYIGPFFSFICNFLPKLVHQIDPRTMMTTTVRRSSALSTLISSWWANLIVLRLLQKERHVVKIDKSGNLSNSIFL
jgi:hypothetical protein